MILGFRRRTGFDCSGGRGEARLDLRRLPRHDPRRARLHPHTGAIRTLDTPGLSIALERAGATSAVAALAPRLGLTAADLASLDVESLPIEDRWILTRVSEASIEVNDALADFQFSRAANAANDRTQDANGDPVAPPKRQQYDGRTGRDNRDAGGPGQVGRTRQERDEAEQRRRIPEAMGKSGGAQQDRAGSAENRKGFQASIGEDESGASEEKSQNRIQCQRH